VTRNGESHAGKSGFVAIVGWTNVGKSTLLKRLVGEKVAAVSDVSQTTRNRITGVLTLEDRGQLVFVDTPGFHRPRFKMNRAMVDLAMEAIQGVDLVLQLVDAEKGIGKGDEETAGILASAGVPRLIALNKIDRVTSKSRLLPMLDLVVNDWGFPEAIPISALTGEGCEELLERLVHLLPMGRALFPEDYLTDQPERSLAAEFVREKILLHAHQELPHATAVVIEAWAEEEGAVEIDATILVETDSQKGIIIGKRGEFLKKIGTEARMELERLLDTRVMLRLWVKVRKGWRNDERTLHDIGLSSKGF
jgi:GTP-binding protein Era